MNGATAEPYVSTIRPPSRTIMIRTGSSQNFLRALMKSQSSAIKDMVTLHLLELLFHRRQRGLFQVDFDPVGFRIRVEFLTQQVFATRAHNKACWRDGDKEQDAHHDRRHDLTEQYAELELERVQRREQLWRQKCQPAKHRRDACRPQAYAAVTKQREQRNQQKTMAKTIPNDRSDPILTSVLPVSSDIARLPLLNRF